MTWERGLVRYRVRRVNEWEVIRDFVEEAAAARAAILATAISGEEAETLDGGEGDLSAGPSDLPVVGTGEDASLKPIHVEIESQDQTKEAVVDMSEFIPPSQSTEDLHGFRLPGE